MWGNPAYQTLSQHHRNQFSSSTCRGSNNNKSWAHFRKMKQNVSRKYKYGYCQYGDNCRYRHVDEICNDKTCTVFACEQRHPKICNFYREFQRCKFTTFCKYKHEKQNNVNENSERIDQLENLRKEIKRVRRKAK